MDTCSEIIRFWAYKGLKIDAVGCFWSSEFFLMSAISVIPQAGTGMHYLAPCLKTPVQVASVQIKLKPPVYMCDFHCKYIHSPLFVVVSLLTDVYVFMLTHWWREAYIYISKFTTIGSDKGLLPVRHLYLNQCWNIVDMTLGNKLLWIIDRDWYVFIKENTLANVICEMSPFWRGLVVLIDANPPIAN